MTELSQETQKQLEITYFKYKDSMSRLTKFLSNNNFTLLYELDYKLKHNPGLLEDFKKNPSLVIEKETGLVIPKGDFHFHYVDKNNKYYPDETDAINQLMFGENDIQKPWTRLEVRFGIGPECIAACELPGD